MNNPGTEETRSYRNIFKATTLFGGVQVYQILISIIRSKFVAVLLGTAGMGIQGMFLSSISLVTLPERLPDAQNVYHLFPILCSRRDELQAYLKENGVGTLIHYPIPPHRQECYRQYSHLSLPITERIAQEELSIPIGPCISMEEAAEVVSLINTFPIK